MEIYESIIIGAGPAGIQMAYYMSKDNASYLLLEHGKRGGNFFKTFPKHRKLISVNKVYSNSSSEKPTIENILRYDWNSLLQEEDLDSYLFFSKYTEDYYPSADLLVDYLNDFINKYQLNIQHNTTVLNIDKTDDIFRVHCINNAKKEIITYYTHKLFIASGLEPKPISIKTTNPNIFYYHTMPVDKDFYKYKNILILGGGNAAFETANFINDVANEIILCGAERFAWNTHYPGSIRSINMKIIDSYYLKLKVNLDWTNTSHLRHDNKLQYYMDFIEKDNISKLNIDVVIICLGFKPALEYLDNISIPIELSKYGFPKLSNFYESISCKNVYFLGSLTQEHDYKHGTSAFIHGFRYNTRVLYTYLKNSFNRILFTNIIDLNLHLLKEVNTSSQLLHRFDYHSHIVLFNKNTASVIHNIPLECIFNINDLLYLFNTDKYLIESSILASIHLGYDYRNTFYKSFRQPQTGNPYHMNESVFIHPIIRFYKYCCTEDNMVQLHELHLPEQAFNVFTGDLYYYEILLRYWILTYYLLEIPLYEAKKNYQEYESMTKFMYHHM